MRITYLYHSGFCVETESMILIFDYYKGKIPKFETRKEVVVFVSHKHEDHYNPDIFELVLSYPQIKFILPNDMKMSESYIEKRNIPKEARNKIIYMKKNDNQKINDLIAVRTLRSTDAGVAYLVSLESYVIYHAGDLNCWVWEGESKKEQNQMEHDFCNEIDQLKGMRIDVAFLPLDPRLENTYYRGFDYFMKTVDTKIAIPMHFWEQPEIISKLCEREDVAAYRERIMALTVAGESVDVFM